MEMDGIGSRFLPEEREKIVQGFEAWLDAAVVDEQAPQGLTAELLSALEKGEPLPPVHTPGNSGGCDLYSLWAAMTTLTQEVRLQGRAFKQLSQANEALLQRLAVAESTDSVKASNLPSPSRREIDLLLDLRDRIERGESTARSAAEELAPARLPRLARWFGVGQSYARHTQEIFAAVSQGYKLTLDTLDEALQAIHVGRIACQGRPFDAQRMTAVGVKETDSVAEGTVVEIYRNGYELDGEVYRPAQVSVARAPRKGNA